MAFVFVFSLTLLGQVDAAPFTIGGFDLSRGGYRSLASASDLSKLRIAIENSFPGVILTESSTLTDTFLSSLDVLMISSVTSNTSGTTPLTSMEQTALRNFVEAGGGAIVLVDNNAFAGGNTDVLNESFIDPFGLDITGTFGGMRVATVINPSHPVTNGVFGLVSSTTMNYPGFFDNLGPDAASLATLNANSEPAVAVIDWGKFSPTSGGIVFFSDSGMIQNSVLDRTDNKTLILNAIDFAATDVSPSPTAAFTVSPAQGDGPITIKLDASTSTDDDTIISYAWIVNGENFSRPVVNVNFAKAGEYPITLIVTDNDGQTDTVTKNVLVVNGGDYDAGYQAGHNDGYQEGSASCPAPGEASATITEKLNIHISRADYQTLLGTIPLWADLEFVPTDDDEFWWKLSQFELLSE